MQSFYTLRFGVFNCLQHIDSRDINFPRLNLNIEITLSLSASKLESHLTNLAIRIHTYKGALEELPEGACEYEWKLLMGLTLLTKISQLFLPFFYSYNFYITRAWRIKIREGWRRKTRKAM